MNVSTDRDVALEPLRAALTARAQADADRVRACAEADERQALAAAREQAAALLADARTQGEEEAAALHALERARARRDARQVVLRAQRDAYEQLRERARDAIRELLADPAWRHRLITVVCRQLGEQAQLQEPAGGGVIAESPDGRRIDTSVDALTERAVATLDLEPLWTSS